MKSFTLLLTLIATTTAAAQSLPRITLDEFFSTADISASTLAPDGSAAVIEIAAPDYKQNRFTKDLWLWTKTSNTLTQITHTGHETSPLFSPDGRYIAFLSDRSLASDADPDANADKDAAAHIWILPLAGGEAFPLYREPLDPHAFAWSTDSSAILFTTTQPLSKDAEDAHKAEWKDVVRWREQERGDVLLALPIADALKQGATPSKSHPAPTPDPTKPEYPAGARIVTTSPLEIDELTVSPDGSQIAFKTTPVSHRIENLADYELFLVPTAGGEPRQLTHNEGVESNIAFTPSGRSLDFLIPAASGSVEGPYNDVQGRLYTLDLATSRITRLGTSFVGSWSALTLTADGKLVATGLTGITTGLYRVDGDTFTPITTQKGSFSNPAAALHGTTLLYQHSAINQTTQLYLAPSLADIDKAQPLTAINPIFAQRAQPTWKPYRWIAPDGVPVYGVLIYPPGKQDAKNLRMLTLIHGGPADADGDRFEADWYDWSQLAAANDWLVFRPNYRGSSGYGDAFQLGIMPHLVSTPGKDILAGVDALVKDGIADPARLAIGGYSYGGYMTNWLITQTPRFKAAVTGAGAVEHAANWGFDDETRDDAWYLSGYPWEKPELYQSEAALFQLNKVTTPTHLVGGEIDNRVSFFEDVTLERALQTLKVPHTFLAFPGENHPLAKNPWHGYIKVREELKWLNQYDPQ